MVYAFPILRSVVNRHLEKFCLTSCPAAISFTKQEVREKLQQEDTDNNKNLIGVFPFSYSTKEKALFI